MRKIFIFAIFLSFLFLFYSCEIKEINVGYPTKFDIEELSLQSIKLKIFIPIDNPNKISFKVKKADLDLYVGNAKIGKIKNLEKTTIEAKTKKSYPIYFEITTLEAISNVYLLYKELKKSKPELKIDGYITVHSVMITKKIAVKNNFTIDK